MAAAQILVAEDEPGLLALINEALRERGFAVATAADGFEAKKILDDTRSIELLLSDIRMPKMDGYELAETAIKLRPEIKIVMMTGYVELPPELLRAREIRVLQKPIDLDRLCGLIGDMLSRA